MSLGGDPNGGCRQTGPVRAAGKPRSALRADALRWNPHRDAQSLWVPTPKTVPALPALKPEGATVQAEIAQWRSTLTRMADAGHHAFELEKVKAAILEGVRLEPREEPEPGALANTPAVRRNITLCKERVGYYFDIGALEILEARPELLQPLHVVEKPDRKARMCLDLSRNFNDLIDTERFKMQSIRDAVELSSPGSFYGKLDIADCFLSFPVHTDSRRFLAFELDGAYYRFKRLPFGLCSAPLWTDRFLSCIDFALREAGLRFVRYCDDFLLVGDSATEVKAALEQTALVLAAHGLVVHPDKTTEVPTRSIEFLGLGINSADQTLFVPEDKRKNLLGLIGRMASRKQTTRKHLQSLIGKFSFVAAVLPGARPFFRHLIDATKGLKARAAPVAVSPEVAEDLRAWQVIIAEWNGREPWVKRASFRIDHDASKEGFGFLLNGVPEGFDPEALPRHLRPGQCFAGLFSEEHLRGQVARSIQWAELFAIATSLSLYGPWLRDKHVLVRTDNMTDVQVILRQSTRSPDLLPLLRSIYATCAAHNIVLSAEHVPGALNNVPDHLSRPALHEHATRCTHADAFGFHTHFLHSSSLELGAGLRPSTYSFRPCWN